MTDAPDPLDDIQVTAEELKAELSDRGLMEFEIASLRVTNRKLIARLNAVLNSQNHLVNSQNSVTRGA